VDLSYTAFAQLLECPRAYAHRYVTPREHGKRNAPIPPQAAVGVLVERLVQRFYRDKLWLETTWEAHLTLQGALPEVAREVYQESSGVLSGALEEDVSDLLPRVVLLIHREGLGQEGKTEVTYRHPPLMGRADIVLADTTLLDGKVVRDPSRVSPLQLHWYRMVAGLCGVPVLRTGFAFWRQSKVVWHEPEEASVKQLERQASLVVKSLTGRAPTAGYLPNPGGHCQKCPWLAGCPEGKAENAAHTQRRPNFALPGLQVTVREGSTAQGGSQGCL